MKILLTIGTRPQIIKTSVLINSLTNIGFEVILVHTGQHYIEELSDVFFNDFQLRTPDYNLKVGSGDYKYQIQTGTQRLLDIIEVEKPDAILIIGDSNPVIVGSLGAFVADIRLAHIEAGLRSYDLREPEERNRIFADSISDILFCSTEENKKTLMDENVSGESFVTGDLLHDAWLKYSDYVEQVGKEKFAYVKENDFYLFTSHRKSNAYNVNYLNKLINMFSEPWDKQIFWPIHPGVLNELKKHSLLEKFNNIKTLQVLPALSYFEFQWFIRNSRAVITDAVGVQVEAYLSKKPSVILRDKIEHTSIEKLGWSARLSPEKLEQISCFGLIKELCSKQLHHNDNLFGDGNSADKIAQYLYSFCKENSEPKYTCNCEVIVQNA
jgi:UDP-N-acetylglucosamine 2-epimerase (non-hydrolysing)